MSHYSKNLASMRVDFFKPDGKWSTTEEILWEGYSARSGSIYDNFRLSLEKALKKDGKYQCEGMIAVCLEPYHEHSHPLMTVVGADVVRGILNYLKMAKKQL